MRGAYFTPVAGSPRTGRTKSRPAYPSAAPDWSSNRPVWTSRPRRPAQVPARFRWVPDLSNEQTHTCLAQGPARPRSVRSPSPAWAGTKSPPPRSGRVWLCGRSERGGACDAAFSV